MTSWTNFPPIRLSLQTLSSFPDRLIHKVDSVQIYCLSDSDQTCDSNKKTFLTPSWLSCCRACFSQLSIHHVIILHYILFYISRTGNMRKISSTCTCHRLQWICIFQIFSNQICKNTDFIAYFKVQTSIKIREQTSLRFDPVTILKQFELCPISVCSPIGSNNFVPFINAS